VRSASYRNARSSSNQGLPARVKKLAPQDGRWSGSNRRPPACKALPRGSRHIRIGTLAFPTLGGLRNRISQVRVPDGRVSRLGKNRVHFRGRRSARSRREFVARKLGSDSLDRREWAPALEPFATDLRSAQTHVTEIHACAGTSSPPEHELRGETRQRSTGCSRSIHAARVPRAPIAARGVARGRWGACRSSPSGSRSRVAPAGAASAEARSPKAAGCTPRAQGR
jgi:hypothetical protein